LFYLAADSVVEVSTPAVLAAPYVKPTGADRIEEERKKSGNNENKNSQLVSFLLIDVFYFQRKPSKKSTPCKTN
jgi:hypothetical protein